jgi:adenylylsulfate kinase
MIYWFTGQSGSGKTTIANELIKLLSFNDCIIVDGDDLRDIFKNKDYSETGRRKNVERAQDIAKFLNYFDKNVIVTLVSPYRNQREAFKKELGNQIKEIYIHTSNIRGKEHFHVNYYEPPLENYINIDTTDKVLLDTIREVLKEIYK